MKLERRNIMSKEHHASTKIINQHGPLGFIFFVAFVGAVVYFVQQSEGFWGFILAILKAIVWPAFVIYHVLQLLGA
jgi:hypothetical protein